METGEDMTKREAKEREFSLRVMEKEDTDRIVGWRNQDFVRRCFIYQKDFTREGHENWIRTMIDTGLAVQFIICIGQRPVGSVYLRDIDRTHQKAEYGIFVGERDAWGQGAGTWAAGEMIRYAFEEEGLVKEAYLRDEVFLEGKYKDVIYMAVINEKESREGME